MKNLARVAFIASFLFVCAVSAVKADPCFDGTVPIGTKCLISQPIPPDTKADEKATEKETTFDLFVKLFQFFYD